MLTNHPQTPLPLVLQPAYAFNTFSDKENQENVALLKKLATGDKEFAIWYCWGSPAVGKTHLAYAVYEQAQKNAIISQYLDLSEATLSPQILEGLEQVELLCLDTLDAVIASDKWQRALFNLINRIMANNHVLLLFSQKNSKDHRLKLADLTSRLAWGINLHIKAVADTNQADLLCAKATHMGFELAPDVAQYLLNHYTRDMKQLVVQLKHLNNQALSQKKQKISIAFVKKALGQA